MSSSAKPFICAVNAAGLPNGRCPQAAQGDENVTGLTASELSWLYWRLESVHVSYAYTVEGQNYSRSYVLMAHNLPRFRLCTPALVMQSNSHETPTPMLVYEGVLRLWPVARSDPFDGTYSVKLSLTEADTLPVMTLALKPVSGFSVIATRTFSFYGRELTAYLSVINGSWSGSIDSFSATPVFYEIMDDEG